MAECSIRRKGMNGIPSWEQDVAIYHGINKYDVPANR